MRKILSGVLAVVMLLSICSLTVFAAGDVDYVEASATAVSGSAVTIVVKASRPTTSGRLSVQYDSELWTYAGGEVNGSVVSTGAENGVLTFGYATEGEKPLAKGASIAVLDFICKKNWSQSEFVATVEDFNEQEGIHIALSGVLAHNPDSDMKFIDVTADKWYYDAVEYVFQKGYFKGTSETTFSPNGTMTRAMFVTVLGRIAGIPENREANTKFTDVKKGSYYAGYVAWASEQGIVLGTSATTFSPNAKVTREQMAVLLFRYAKYAGADVSADSDALNAFTDAASVSGWAKEALAWATDRKILIGTGNGLKPRAQATRAQGAQIIFNFSQYME